MNQSSMMRSRGSTGVGGGLRRCSSSEQRHNKPEHMSVLSNGFEMWTLVDTVVRRIRDHGHVVHSWQQPKDQLEEEYQEHEQADGQQDHHYC